MVRGDKERKRERGGQEVGGGGGGGAFWVKRGRKHIPPPLSVKENNPADVREEGDDLSDETESCGRRSWCGDL